METIKKLTIYLLLLILFSCNQIGSNKSKIITNNQHRTISKTTSQESNTVLDSLKNEEKPSSQDLYSKVEERMEILGELKQNQSTKKYDYKYKIYSIGDEVKITLYAIGERIVLIEKRIFNKNDVVLGYSMFEFDEDNNCISNTIKEDKEKKSYTNDIYWGSLLRYDVDYNKIDIDVSDKQKVINSTRASLDSIMTNFPEFRYTFNWK